MSREASLTASIVITNTGKYQGEEIVQLYIRDMVASITPPVKKLKGFHKISLEPGESKEVSFELKIKDLEFMNGDFEYITEPGSFRLFIGPDSENCKISGFSLTDS